MLWHIYNLLSGKVTTTASDKIFKVYIPKKGKDNDKHKHRDKDNFKDKDRCFDIFIISSPARSPPMLVMTFAKWTHQKKTMKITKTKTRKDALTYLYSLLWQGHHHWWWHLQSGPTNKRQRQLQIKRQVHRQLSTKTKKRCFDIFIIYSPARSPPLLVMTFANWTHQKKTKTMTDTKPLQVHGHDNCRDKCLIFLVVHVKSLVEHVWIVCGTSSKLCGTCLIFGGTRFNFWWYFLIFHSKCWQTFYLGEGAK